MNNLIQVRNGLLILIIFLGFNQAWGQCNPDSLDNITVTGIVDADTSGKKIIYKIDTNSDQLTDYSLNFGPYWYIPIGSDAVRPQDGDSITVFGGLKESAMGIIPVIIVYEINELFWRNPYENYWYQYTDEYLSDAGSYLEGFLPLAIPDTLDIIFVEGFVVVDTTFNNMHYFLDVGGDSIIDFKLNFGPPWYIPEGDIQYPEIGDNVSILGGILHTQIYPVLIVFEINGEIWRDSTLFGPSYKGGGKWMDRHDQLDQVAMCTFDTLTNIKFSNGWHNGNMPPKMFCQILEVHHQYLHKFEKEGCHPFAGFEIGIFNQNRENLMFRNGKRLAFKNSIKLQFHFNKRQMERNGVRNTKQIRLHYWSEDLNLWEEVENAIVDNEKQLIAFETDELFTYYIISADLNTTSVINYMDDSNPITIYPNPSNQTFNLDFTISRESPVKVIVLNAIGIEIYSKDLGVSATGLHHQSIETTKWNQGIYFIGILMDGKFQYKQVIKVN